MTGFSQWSRQAGTKPVQWLKRKPVTRISVKLIPAFFGEHAVNIQPGEPHATIALNRADIWFPDPFIGNNPTDACRDYITEAVRQSVHRDRHERWISWPDGSLTSFTQVDLSPVLQPAQERADR
ncbi:hypothetical protein ASE69_07635 [Sphingomonas sp. Leaf208]|uniref:hypothetical protein n=1 Tax=Sphingomonas sp. Leaf208 TaxID=1735679 RepID=UPI000700D2BE|nr:hypothetical protein [Sphingomonas sp. Leaf208]KQM51179.1 hypothetical protein ASE69_07635 [Sphingomonas sp. Leaf208]